MKLTREQLEWAADTVKGYADGYEKVLREYPDVEDLEDQLLDVNVEKCEGCDWFFDSFELVDDDNDDENASLLCRDCRPTVDEEDE